MRLSDDSQPGVAVSGVEAGRRFGAGGRGGGVELGRKKGFNIILVARVRRWLVSARRLWFLLFCIFRSSWTLGSKACEKAEIFRSQPFKLSGKNSQLDPRPNPAGLTNFPMPSFGTLSYWTILLDSTLRNQSMKCDECHARSHMCGPLVFHFYLGMAYPMSSP